MGHCKFEGGVVCFSGDFAFRINILNSISTPHKHSFFSITNVLPVSRDLSHPFLTFYFNPNLHHFINNTCNLIHFLSMTIDTKFQPRPQGLSLKKMGGAGKGPGIGWSRVQPKYS